MLYTVYILNWTKIGIGLGGAELRIGKGLFAYSLIAAWVALTSLHAFSVLTEATRAEWLAEQLYMREIISPLMSSVEKQCGRNHMLYIQATNGWRNKIGPSLAYEKLAAWQDRMETTEEKFSGKRGDASEFIGNCRAAIDRLYSYAPFDRPWIRHRAMQSSAIFGVVSGLSALALFFLLEWHQKNYGLSKYKWQRTFWVILPGYWVMLFAIVDPDRYLWDPTFLVPGLLIPLFAYVAVWGTVNFALPWIQKGD